MAKQVLGLKVTGIEDLHSALNDLGKRLGKSTLERSLRKAAQPMLDAAKRNAPVDDGDLEKSLKIGKRTISDPGRKAYSAVKKATWDKASQSFDEAGAVNAMRDARRAQGGAVVDLVLGPDLLDGGSQAHLVEFGTGPRYDDNGKYTGEMPPDPFLRPAFDAEAGPTIERLKPILAAEIEKSAKRSAAAKARRAAKKAAGG